MTPDSKNDRRLTVNAPKVAYQVLDGEGLLIHFEHGHYYSASGSAVFLLELVERGFRESELCSALARRFGLELDRARDAVSAFIEELVAEGLFVVAEGALEETVAPAALESAFGSSAAAFEAPKLSKYTDLEDLLVLDPVHDVMMTGWLRPTAPTS